MGLSEASQSDRMSEKKASENGAASPPNETETQPTQEDKGDEPPPRNLSGFKWYITILAILFSSFLYALDATVVADIQPLILRDLGGITKLPWLAVGFLLCATATNLVWGRLYGQFNAKWLYIIHVLLFEVGSAICGAAPTINVLIVGRAIAGAGGSGMYVGCMTLIAATTTLQERPLYVSGTGFTWGAGIVLGPIVGGAFSESSVGWRWAFYINLLIGAVCAPVYLLLLPSKDPQPGKPYRARAAEMDYPGVVLQAATLAAFILAVNWGGVTYPWGSGRIIALFIVSGVLFVALGVQQTWNIGTTPSRRIIPIQFFRSRSVLILFCATAACGACAFVPIYMVPIFFQFTRGDSPLEAGVRLLPFIIVMVVIVFVNGGFMAKLGYYMPWFLVGSLIIVVGGALMYTVDEHTSTSQIYGYTVLIGAGVGMFLQASFPVAQAIVEPENIASAIGFITLAQFVGIAVALAIANSLLLNISQDKIQHILPNTPLKRIQATLLGAGSDLVESLSPDQKTRVLNAIVDAIDQTYVLVIAGGSLVAVLSLIMRRENPFKSAA